MPRPPLSTRGFRGSLLPLRAQALTILNERVASPNEIAEMLGVGLSHVSYRVKVLRDLGWVELVRTARCREAIEHYHRAVARPCLTGRECNLTSVLVK